MKLRYKLSFSFSIPTPGFPHFYYMLGANLGLLLYGEVSVMDEKIPNLREKFPKLDNTSIQILLNSQKHVFF